MDEVVQCRRRTALQLDQALHLGRSGQLAANLQSVGIRFEPLDDEHGMDVFSGDGVEDLCRFGEIGVLGGNFV